MNAPKCRTLAAHALLFFPVIFAFLLDIIHSALDIIFYLVASIQCTVDHLGGGGCTCTPFGLKFINNSMNTGVLKAVTIRI